MRFLTSWMEICSSKSEPSLPLVNSTVPFTGQLEHLTPFSISLRVLSYSLAYLRIKINFYLRIFTSYFYSTKCYHQSNSEYPKFSPTKSLKDQLSASFSKSSSPIWMDSSTSDICREIETSLGGARAMTNETGSTSYERFTIHQIIKFAKEQPQNWTNTERVSLISSFAVSLLIGSRSWNLAKTSPFRIIAVSKKDWPISGVVSISANQWIAFETDTIAQRGHPFPQKWKI